MANEIRSTDDRREYYIRTDTITFYYAVLPGLQCSFEISKLRVVKRRNNEENVSRRTGKVSISNLRWTAHLHMYLHDFVNSKSTFFDFIEFLVVLSVDRKLDTAATCKEAPNTENRETSTS